MKEFKTECMDNVSGFERTNITLFSLQKNTIEQFTDFTKKASLNEIAFKAFSVQKCTPAHRVQGRGGMFAKQNAYFWGFM